MPFFYTEEQLLSNLAVAIAGSGGGGGGGSGDVTSVNGRTGAVVLTKTDVNLSNVDNTSDLNKPISTATQTLITNLSGKTEWQSLTLGGTFSRMFNANTTPVDITQTLNDPLQFTKTSTNSIVDTIGTAPNILLKSSLARNNYTALSIAFRASGVFEDSNERRFDIYLQRNDNLVTIGIGSIFAGANGSITSFNNSVCNFSVSSDINAGLNDGWLTQGYRLFIVGTNSNTGTSITFTNIMLRIQYF
jgi:hypothetical protein